MQVRKRVTRVELGTNKILRSMIGLLVVFGIVYLAGSVLSSPIINAKKYQKLMKVETGEFSKDVKELSYDRIPLLDKDTAALLGDRKMGSMVDMVSQFEADDIYSQINYKNNPGPCNATEICESDQVVYKPQRRNSGIYPDQYGYTDNRTCEIKRRNQVYDQ